MVQDLRQAKLLEPAPTGVSWDFIAGFFDGEGHVRARSKPHESCEIVFSNNNREVLEAVQSFLTPIRSTIYSMQPRKANWAVSYRLVVTRHEDLRYLASQLLDRCIVKHDDLVTLIETIDGRHWNNWGKVKDLPRGKIHELYVGRGLSVARSAGLLGVHEVSLRRRMETLGIPRRHYTMAEIQRMRWSK